jgi:general secretion pathway protein K
VSARDDQGMILVNVLMFVAIATGLVLLMITREEVALDRSLRVREAARAMAAVRGGELSALVALRRDAATAPEVDSAAEPWATLSESGAPIEGGSFDLAIADAEGRFNVNLLRSGNAAATILFQEVARAAGLDEDQTVKAIEAVRLAGPFTDLRPLRAAGFAPEVLAKLQGMVTALPGETGININAATPEVLLILFRDPVVVERLMAVRARNGALTMTDLADQNVSLPLGASFRSNTFWVRTRATIGDTVQQGATLIQRRQADGVTEVWPVERWLNAAVPPDAPPFAVPAA